MGKEVIERLKTREEARQRTSEKESKRIGGIG
jgi:hypothetical protein